MTGGNMIPGERFIKDGEIELNAGRKTVTLSVANTGDRPIQVGSHYHFFETNPALKFDRRKARGMRLDIAAGTAVRFEPGQTRDVQLVALAGKLHDTVEDTGTTLAELGAQFGDRVAALVDEVTDDMSLPKAQRRQRQIEDAPHKSAGAKLIKIADKISNIRARIHSDPSAEE